jgi:hypothetical protein
LVTACGGRTLVALTLQSNHNIIIGENGYWVDDLDETLLKELKYALLGKADENVLKSFLGKLEIDFVESSLNRNLIIEHILIPNFGNENLKLGVTFLHKILSSFKNPFERDLFWSGEAFSSDKWDIATPIMNVKAKANTENPLSMLEFDSDNRHLNTHHPYWGLPMYYAWSLASTNNYLREYCRKSLSKWAANDIKGFIELLDLVFFCGDPQVQEDLARVMLGAVTLIKSKDKNLQLLNGWVIGNIFKGGKIQDIRNSVVRYCARIVVERGFIFEEATESDLNLARPPYSRKDELLELNFDDEDRTHEGRYPIVHDLDWYVIEKSFKDFLDYKSEGSKYDPYTEGVLKPYWEKYEEEIDPNTFAVSAAIAFIKNLGFNRSQREGHSITKESHGKISIQMTLEEKYTWLAVHEIQGYLADIVKYKYYDKSRSFLDDYSMLVHVPNPIDETQLTGYSSHDYIDFAISYDKLKSEEWFIPTDISPKVQFEREVSKIDLEKWVKDEIDHDFEKWITTNDFFTDLTTDSLKSAVVLYNDTHISDPLNIGSVNWSSVCLFIEANKFNFFVDRIKSNSKQYFNSLIDDLEFGKASTKSTYFSPRDLSWMSWVEEDNSINDSNSFGVKIYNSVTKVVEDSVTRGEESYILPSKLIRETCKISNYENGKSFDNDANLITWTHKAGSSSEWENQQEILFIDKIAFDKLLEEKNLKPIWVFYQLKNTTLEFRKDKTSPFAQNCKKWIAWESDGKIEYFKYHDGWYNNQKE